MTGLDNPSKSLVWCSFENESGNEETFSTANQRKLVAASLASEKQRQRRIQLVHVGESGEAEFIDVDLDNSTYKASPVCKVSGSGCLVHAPWETRKRLFSYSMDKERVRFCVVCVDVIACARCDSRGSWLNLCLLCFVLLHVPTPVIAVRARSD